MQQRFCRRTDHGPGRTYGSNRPKSSAWGAIEKDHSEIRAQARYRDPFPADKKAKAIIAELRAGKMSKAADLVEQTVCETLTYCAFPDIHWQKIRTNNPLERIMREIQRRTRVVGAFPDGQSCLNLAAARLRYIAGSA